MIDLHIKKAYYKTEKPVVCDFSLTVEKGEILTLQGPSGSGKSTVLKIIAGGHEGFDGALFIKNDAKIAMIPQNKYLPPWKTVLKNTILLRKTKEKTPDTAKALALLDGLGLKGLEERYPLSLSGGQYQRVMLAQALFYEPDILLMDEPYSALDDDTKREIVDLFLRSRQEKGFTTVFVTHSAQEAEWMGGRIVRLTK